MFLIREWGTTILTNLKIITEKGYNYDLRDAFLKQYRYNWDIYLYCVYKDIIYTSHTSHITLRFMLINYNDEHNHLGSSF